MMTATEVQSETWLREKLANTIALGEAPARSAMRALVEQGNAMKDMLVPTHAMTFSEGERGMRFYVQGGSAESHASMSVHENAIEQVAGKMEVPTRYAKDLASGDDWQRVLLADILNRTSMNRKNTNMLVRSVGGDVRAILSDRYRRMDNLPVFNSFMQAAGSHGARLLNGHLSDLSMYLEVIHPDITFIDTPNNGRVAVALGAQISSSDFGRGSLEVRSFVMQVICGNGMALKPIVRQVHLGRKMDERDFAFSQRTMSLDTETMASAVGDMVALTFSPDQRDSAFRKILIASSKEVDPEMVPTTLKNNNVSVDETEQIMAALMSSRTDDGVQGEVTVWKLTQAMTAVARSLESERAREIQRIAGGMLS